MKLLNVVLACRQGACRQLLSKAIVGVEARRGSTRQIAPSLSYNCTRLLLSRVGRCSGLPPQPAVRRMTRKRTLSCYFI